MACIRAQPRTPILQRNEARNNTKYSVLTNISQ